MTFPATFICYEYVIFLKNLSLGFHIIVCKVEYISPAYMLGSGLLCANVDLVTCECMTSIHTISMIIVKDIFMVGIEILIQIWC